MKIAGDVFVAKSAIILGDVEIGDKSSVWFNAVIRGDENKIVIGKKTNIQDCCVLHTEADSCIKIGSEVTIGHGAVIHGAEIESCCLIGINATILDGARIGKGSLIAAGSVITPGTRIPSSSIVMGVPGRVVKKDEEAIEKIRKNAEIYCELAKKKYRL